MIGVIILAAGQGKRMKSSIPKVLHLLGGKPVVSYTLEAVSSLHPDQILMVLSPELKDSPLFKDIPSVVQNPPKGTADAVHVALNYLTPDIQHVIILCGDTPLLTSQTLQTLKQSSADLTVIGFLLDHFEQSYGRIMTDEYQCPQAIVEYKDATPEQKQIPWANSGVYKISVALLRKLLPQIAAHNQAQEYYLTDLVELAYRQGYSLKMQPASAQEFHGINTRQDLSQAEEILQNQWRENLMNQGVTLFQPETIILHHDTKIGTDCRIGPFVTFGPGVQLEPQVTILPFCHLENTIVESTACVGPFAHIRGNSRLRQGAMVGNFVEVKGSTLGKKTKAKHLAYLGDATVGDQTNIGAGVVTCNYNGFKKFKTTIGDKAMIGANSSLIAPLSIGHESLIAAGSVITQDVPDEALSLSRPSQIIKDGGGKRFQSKHKKSL